MLKHVVYICIIAVLLIIIGKLLYTSDVDAKVLGTTNIDGVKYDILRDSIDTVWRYREKVTYKKGKDIYHDTTIYKPIYTLADAFTDRLFDSIYQSYVAKNVYTDTVEVDSFGNIYITDTLQMNEILGRGYITSIKVPTVRETIIVDKPSRSQLYMGLKTSFINKGIESIGTGIMLKTRKNNMYGIGTGINRNKNVNFTLDFYMKL